MTLGEVSRRSRATTANEGAKKSAKHLYRKLLLKFPIDKHQCHLGLHLCTRL